MPRQSVFVGTTNASEYLTDSTGGRRFWPVRCTNIDIEALAHDREQLWAEAVTAYHAAEHWWLDAAATRDAMQREQEERRIADPWEDIISAWLEEPTRLGHDGVRVPFNLERGRVANALILDHAICKPTERQTTSDQMRVGKILARLGWTKRKRGKANRVEWERGETPQSAPDAPESSVRAAEKPESAPQGVSPGEVSRQGVSPETRGNGGGADRRDTADTFSSHVREGHRGQNGDSGVRGVSPGLPEVRAEDEIMDPNTW